MNEDNKQIKNDTKAEKKSLPCPNQRKKPAGNEEFKRRYFEFYDDIKISDRQDW